MRDRDKPASEYLSDLSPKDKPWDKHKHQTQQVERLYQGTIYDRLAERMQLCSGRLAFCWAEDPQTKERRLKLKCCRFCRVRHCPICQWRRSLMWLARFLRILPSLQNDYPTARYLLLTLTVKNPEMSDLRATLTHLNASWKRFTHRKQFPAIGFARSTEVTKGKDGLPHPHFHALLMVKASYFSGQGYMTQSDWVGLWRDCLQVDYLPKVNVQAVKPGLKHGTDELSAAVVETFKYATKPEHLLSDRDWLVALTKQLHKTRAIALGGVFKQYLSESEPEDLLTESETSSLSEEASKLYFGWREVLKHYVQIYED